MGKVRTCGVSDAKSRKRDQPDRIKLRAAKLHHLLQNRSLNYCLFKVYPLRRKVVKPAVRLVEVPFARRIEFFQDVFNEKSGGGTEGVI